MFHDIAGKVHFFLMLGVAGLTDFVQIKIAIFNSIPYVGTVLYITASALISIFAWLTFFAWITVLERTPRAYGQVKRAVRERVSAKAPRGRVSKAGGAAQLVQNPTRYMVMRAVTYGITLFVETVIGILPTFTLMVLVLYLVDWFEARARRILGEKADQLALAMA